MVANTTDKHSPKSEIPGFIVPNIFYFNNDQLTGIFTMVMKIW